MHVARRCWACSLGCFWRRLIANVVEKCRGGCWGGVLWKVRVLLDISLRRGRVVGGGWLCVCVAGRRCGGCCPGCRWWCLIAIVVEGVAYRVSLVVFDFVLMMREWDVETHPQPDFANSIRLPKKA